MSEAGAEPFGAPSKKANALAPVPMFDPLLHSARQVVESVAWFRREVNRADQLCANMEQVVGEMVQAKIAEHATKQVELSVARLREQVTKAHQFCERMEGLTADLQGGDIFDAEFKMPRMLTKQGGG